MLFVAGGALIGLGASTAFVFLGKVAGVSGCFGQALTRGRAAGSFPLGFLLGLFIVGGLVRLLAGGAGAEGRAMAGTASLLGPWGVVAAGGLVGLGTRLARGCTSGHGVCGVSRLAPRSLVATLVFVAFGMLTATLLTRLHTGGA